MAVIIPHFTIKGGGKTSAGASQTLISEVPFGAMDGSNVTFTLSFAPSACSGLAPAYAIWLFLNEARQSPYYPAGAPQYVLNGNVITYKVAPASTDHHEVLYFIGPSAGDLPGSARNFAGGTNQLNYGASTLYRLLGDMSAGIWMKPRSDSAGVIIKRGINSVSNSESFNLLIKGSSGAWDVGYLHDYGSNQNEQHTFSTQMLNDQWRYFGISRDNTAKTIKAYLRTGSTMTLIDTWAYSHDPEDSDSGSRLTLGNDVGGSGGAISPAPLTAALQEHYLWSRAITSDEHLAASNGNPDATGLVLSSPMGKTPELDVSGNGGVGVVTGTTLVQGHN